MSEGRGGSVSINKCPTSPRNSHHSVISTNNDSRRSLAAHLPLTAYLTKSQDIVFIFEQVNNLFADTEIWPSRRAAFFYLGVLPVFVPPQHRDSTMRRRIAQNAHTRIWGDVRRRHTPRSKANPALTTHPTCPRKTLTLPAHLARIVPQPSLPRVFLKFPLISLFPSLRSL
jgi:hypothetical protein